jgi:hypothetical protein
MANRHKFEQAYDAGYAQINKACGRNHGLDLQVKAACEQPTVPNCGETT